MSRAPLVSILALASACVLGVPAYGQAVISTRAGVVNFFEGEVTVAGQPLEARLGKFATVPEGAELRTAKGRAELLLTPGVFLRVDQNSAIRMAANSLADTRVELLAGSALVDSRDPATGTSVTLLFQNWTIHQAGAGAYRVDANPARVVAREGEVQVAGGQGPVKVEQGMQVPLAAVLAPEPVTGAGGDPLAEWAQGRADSVAADDAIAAGIQDPAAVGSNTDAAWADAGLPADGFTYFPMLGLSSVDPALYNSGVYGVNTPLLGFNSVYLPGYNYRPMLLGLPLLGLGYPYSNGLRVGNRVGGFAPGLPGSYPYIPYAPTRLGSRYPTTGAPVGRYPAAGAPIGRYPVSRPVPARPMGVPHGGGHIGGGRR